MKDSESNEVLDLSSDQDLSIAIMNLVGIEEHFFFTGAKTGKTEYFDLLNEVRNIRKDLLKKLIKEYEGEVWCISKHLLAASYRLYEVGTKQLSAGNKEEAYDFFDKAYNLYSLFWGVNMKLFGPGEAAGISSEISTTSSKEKSTVMHKLSAVVSKIVNCCRE